MLATGFLPRWRPRSVRHPGIREWSDWLSGRMNPDPRDKTRKARLSAPGFSLSPAVARSRNRTITFLSFFLFIFVFSLRPLFFVSVSIFLYMPPSPLFFFETSILLRPDFFLGNVSKTIGGPRIIARGNQSRIEFRDRPLELPQDTGKRGTCEKEKRDRYGGEQSKEAWTGFFRRRTKSSFFKSLLAFHGEERITERRRMKNEIRGFNKKTIAWYHNKNKTTD